MAFKQVRYQVIDNLLVTNIFPSDKPMDGWFLDAGAAEKAYYEPEESNELVEIEQPEPEAEVEAKVEKEPAPKKRGRPPKKPIEVDTDANSAAGDL